MNIFAQSKIKASSGETVRQLTIRGHGIARLSEFEIWKDMEEGRLIALFEDKIEHQYQASMLCIINKSIYQNESVYSLNFGRTVKRWF